jgi:inner membrane transporter RhtA
VLAAICSVQLGAAFAKVLFEDLGPAGTVFLRTAFAAIILLAVWRPWRSLNTSGIARRDEVLLVVAFGVTLAAMNLCFYEALSRVPLGIAVTLEFTGPLAVAVAGSRRALDVLWVVLAAAGILLLAPIGALGASDIDPLGAGLALLAGAFWAAYILLGARTGRVFPGGTGLAMAMGLSTVLLVPFGVADAGVALLDPRLLAAGLGVALLSSAIPYSLELEALRRLPARVFGVLMSLEPAVGALLGFVVLGEMLGLRAIVAIALVVTASVGVSLVKRPAFPPKDPP